MIGSLMFRAFFLRSYRSFSRNLIVSLLPLAMPIVFLLLFLDATGDTAKAPSLRVGVSAEQAASPLTEAMIESGVVSIDEIPADADTKTIDARRFDALLLPAAPGEARPTLLVRPGFERWTGMVLASIAERPQPVAQLPGTTAAVEPATAAGRPAAAASPVQIKISEAGPNGYLSFILPGLFVMVLIQLSMTSTASVVLNDRADGTFRMVSSVKGAVLPLLGAEILFRLIFAVLCYLFMMVVIWQAAGDWLGDRLVLFTTVFFLGATMMIAFGYTLGGMLPGRRNWSAVITLTTLAFWFFSDILFQASQHALARPLSLILPPTYLTDALRQIATRQPGTFSLAFDVAMIALFLTAFCALSVRFFRFETNDDRM
jgi:ABC-2 type transport system permease protein